MAMYILFSCLYIFLVTFESLRGKQSYPVHTLGKVSRYMLSNAASSNSFHASALWCICIASAFAFAFIMDKIRFVY